MSIGAITKVFATCPEEKSEYLVLIAMADQANDDGRDIWFKWETIAHKARIDPRTAQLIVEKLLKKALREQLRAQDKRQQAELDDVIGARWTRKLGTENAVE